MTKNQPLKIEDEQKWQAINPYITFCDVSKSFYKDHFYKIVLDISSASISVWTVKSFLSREDSRLASFDYFHNYLEDSLYKRREWLNSFGSTYFKSWAKEFDIDLLTELGTLLYHLQAQVKHRVEGGRLSFFFKTEDDANSFIEKLSGMLVKKVHSIHRPVNNDVKQIIERGSVILKTKIPQKYQVILKAGFYQKQECDALLSYLNSINARFTEYLKYQLSGNEDKRYFSEIRFYIHEETEAMLAHLIVGNRVGKISKVEYLD